MGAAAATYTFLRQIGMAIGVGIGGTVFQNAMALKLSWEGLETNIAKHSEVFIAELKQMPNGSVLKLHILDAVLGCVVNIRLKRHLHGFRMLGGDGVCAQPAIEKVPYDGGGSDRA